MRAQVVLKDDYYPAVPIQIGLPDLLFCLFLAHVLSHVEHHLPIIELKLLHIFNSVRQC